MIAVLRKLYVVDSFQLLLDGTPGTMVFVVVSGVHEGSCLSPLLFIFFIRGLPAYVKEVRGTDAPVINKSRVPILLYADDVTEMSLTENGLQVETDACVAFFLARDLEVNPGKSDLMCFVRPRSEFRTFACRIGTVMKDAVHVVRYLGIYFDARGNWKQQKNIVIARAKVSLGRCKTIVNTIGRRDTKQLITLFDSVVASVYRYGLGAWGPAAGNLKTIDSMFTDYVTWLYDFPRTTSKKGLLACFGRRCVRCDSLFLAANQLAGAKSTSNPLWRELVDEFKGGQRKGKWFKLVTEELKERRMLEPVFNNGDDFLCQRKAKGVLFAKFCFHNHLNTLTGTSADLFRKVQPSGVFPFLVFCSPNEGRHLFSFILSNWRWIDKSVCRTYPRFCTRCQCDVNSWHILFECSLFEDLREFFWNKYDISFDFEAMLVCTRLVSKGAASIGRRIFERMISDVIEREGSEDV